MAQPGAGGIHLLVRSGGRRRVGRPVDGVDQGAGRRRGATDATALRPHPLGDGLVVHRAQDASELVPVDVVGSEVDRVGAVDQCETVMRCPAAVAPARRRGWGRVQHSPGGGEAAEPASDSPNCTSREVILSA